MNVGSGQGVIQASIKFPGLQGLVRPFGGGEGGDITKAY